MRVHYFRRERLSESMLGGCVRLQEKGRLLALFSSVRVLATQCRSNLTNRGRGQNGVGNDRRRDSGYRDSEIGLAARNVHASIR